MEGRVELDELDAPEVDGYDGPPLDDDLEEPAPGPASSARARVLPFVKPPKPRKPRAPKTPRERPALPTGRARTALRDDLAQGVAAVGIAASLGMPTTGHVICDRSTGIADATLKLAETNPAVAAALMATSVGMTYLDLGTHAGAILTAAMVDRGMIDPYATPAAMLKVTAAWEATHPEEAAYAQEQADAAAAGVYVGPPPTPAFV